MKLTKIDISKEKLKHDGIKSLNKTVGRYKINGRVFEIDLCTDSNLYDIFEVTNNEENGFGVGFESLKQAKESLRCYFYNKE